MGIFGTSRDAELQAAREEVLRQLRETIAFLHAELESQREANRKLEQALISLTDTRSHAQVFRRPPEEKKADPQKDQGRPPTTYEEMAALAYPGVPGIANFADIEKRFAEAPPPTTAEMERALGMDPLPAPKPA